LVVGVTDGAVSLISAVTDKESVDMMLLEASEREAAGAKGRANFADFVRRLGAKILPVSGNAAIPFDAPHVGAISAAGLRDKRKKLGGL
jgi:hypothetical protein